MTAPTSHVGRSTRGICRAVHVHIPTATMAHPIPRASCGRPIQSERRASSLLAVSCHVAWPSASRPTCTTRLNTGRDQNSASMLHITPWRSSRWCRCRHLQSIAIPTLPLAIVPSGPEATPSICETMGKASEQRGETEEKCSTGAHPSQCAATQCPSSCPTVPSAADGRNTVATRATSPSCTVRTGAM